MTGSATVIRADARQIPLPDNSVDLICTSPPYFGLRSYTNNGVHFESQIGSEATPGEWLEALWACTAEWVRVLKPEGSLFVNLGDKYNSAASNQQNSPAMLARRSERAKSLLGLPWRYAIGCMDRLGLILRAEIVWAKPNGLPESVTDRVRRSHEQIFHFTRQPRYYSAVDAIRLPTDPPRRALRTPLRPVTHRQEHPATVRTGDGVFTVQGVCALGSLVEPVEPAMAGDAQRLQVAVIVGLSLRLELSEGPYVADFQPHALGPAADAPMSVALKDALTQLLPPGASPSAIPAAPSGILVAGTVVPDAWRRAEVTGLDCALCAPEGLAARITLDLHPGQATLLVWCSSRSSHESSLPNGNTSPRHPTPDYRIERDHDALHPLGKLPGSVWAIPSQPLVVPDSLGIQHFAAFPMELPRRIILGWSPPGVCTACHQGRRPVTRQVDEAYAAERARVRDNVHMHTQREKALRQMIGGGPSRTTAGGLSDISNGVVKPDYRITGYACGCPEPSAPTRPARVVDPFGGTGTTALVASVLGRDGFSFDLSMDYTRLARWRVNDPGERARAMEVPRPPKQVDGQDALFELER